MKYIIALVLISASVVHARGLSDREFENLVTSEVRRCPTLNCSHSRVTVSQPGNESLDLFRFQELMQEVALDFWPDTILESAIVTDFQAQVDPQDLENLIFEGRRIGYRIHFSAEAWDMDHCVPTPRNPASYEEVFRSCRAGRVYDRGFVNRARDFTFHDDSSVPTFNHNPANRRME